MSLIYQTGQVKRDVFIKLGDNKGIKFGELKYPLYLQSKTSKPKDPSWSPARENDNWNSFQWMDDEGIKNASPIKQQYIDKFDLLNFAIKELGAKELLRYVFE